MKNYLELSDLFNERSLSEKLLDLAKRLKTYRKKAKLTQLQLSDRSGIPYGTLKRFERTGLISLRDLWMLATALGCDDQLDNLFSSPPLTADDLRGGA